MLPHFPYGRTRRNRRGSTRTALAMALGTSVLVAATLAPAPSLAARGGHHTLSARKASLSSSLARSHADLDEVSARLISAQRRLDAGVAELRSARARLTNLRGEVRRAAARDRQLQAQLDVATLRLHGARADLSAGRATVETLRSRLAAYAVATAHADLTQLSTLSLVFGADSTRQALDQVQGADTALDAQLAELQRLQANQTLLHYTEQRVLQNTEQVAADRAAAAAHLTASRQLAGAAAAASAAVRAHVTALQGRRDSLTTARRAELARIATMQRERAQLAAQLRRVAERRAAAGSSATAGSTSADTGFLSYPVRDTYITSPYGMRLHPILHIWELHDGTDFHAPCGSPVYAAADGRVTSEYYNVAYGNRLLIDHGVVRGVSLWTSYNHLTSFVAGVGQVVHRGQLVAYSGTTGYSTGCHLHFMVYVNGYTVDPMTWL